MKTYCKKLLFTYCIIASCAAHSGANQKYHNARLALNITYPNLLSEVTTADRGDGFVAKTKSLSAELRVWGNLIVEQKLKTMYLSAQTEKNSTVTYSKLNTDSFAISGTRQNGTRIFYRYTVFDTSAGLEHSLLLEYPSSEKEKFEPLIKSLISQLRKFR